MLQRFRKLKSIAPPPTPLEDFTHHWKNLMNFYINNTNDCKVPIQLTNIPKHIDRLLDILLEEEQDENDPGPCLEYLLQHKLLDLLASLAISETPPGMRMICLSFLRRLLGRSKYPLLHQTSIYLPIQRLIVICNGNSPSPIETEEIQFLLTLCFLVCKYPHVTNIINDVPMLQKLSSSKRSSSERLKIEKVTYVPNRKKNNSNPLFEPLNTQAIALVNPNLLNPEKNRQKSLCSNISSIKIDLPSSSTRSNASTSSKDTENISQSSSPLTQNVYCNSTLTMNLPDDTQNNQNITDKLCDKLDNPVAEIKTCLQNIEDLRLTEDGETNNPIKNNCDLLTSSRISAKSKCLLLEALMSYLNSADNTVRVRACEGIMALASLEDTTFVEMVTQSDLPSIITSRLENLFNTVPAHVDPDDIDIVDVTWGLDSPSWTKKNKFPGCRQVAAFYMWFDYCNQLIREASTNVADVLAKHIRINFFEKIVTPALADHQVILVTALIAKCVKELASSTLCTEVGYWLVGHNRHPEILNVCTSPVLHRLISNCYTDSDELTVETLKLFEEVIEKRNEHTLHCLVLIYLTNRGYYDNTAADSAITSKSDEEDEKERGKKRTLDFSYKQGHSKTLAPSNIYRIIHCFLSMVPRYLQTDPHINSYKRCMVVLEKQYSTILKDCFLMAWPLEAVTHDDSASSDSRPEADHGATRFYMGPFLTMLFDKVCNMTKQRYEINLRLTVLISRLTLIPHPYLHEFLLNPLLPLVSGTKSLFTCLQKVVKQLIKEIPRSAESKQKLKETREKLLDEYIDDMDEEDILLESAVVTEEFCNTLAATAYVKYHHSVLKLWKTVLVDKLNCNENCINILQHCAHIRNTELKQTEKINTNEKVFRSLILASKTWNLKITKCTLQNERVCLFLERPSVIKTIINTVIQKGPSFGRNTSIHENICLTFLPDEQSELTSMRLQLIKNISERILDLQGYCVCKSVCPNSIMLTSKSNREITENCKRYVCGVVKNSETNTKETTLTWSKYIYNKMETIMEVNEERYLHTSKQNTKNNSFFQNMAEATVTFELLAIKPSRPICINVHTSGDRNLTNTKGIPFILYNTARIAAIIKKYNEGISNGEYPELTNIETVDFSVLDDEDEWELIYNFIVGYSQAIENSIKHKPIFQICPQVLCMFLSRLCQKFSIYYRRIKILTEGYKHLYSKLIARIYMLKALEIILQNTLAIFDIESVSQM
ncbi:FHF complex subunit HOOK interacting protein 2A-like isoform X2 [Vespula squamosa]|uniref:FHF complex subunit HOOK interacting protein 2A-like isoform X2 n=1 Tax=Vespula squamosa TaxID=30214 RepID=A0ABD2AKH8_VESSQ